MSRTIEATYQGRIKQGFFMHNKQYVKLYFVENGKRVDRGKLLNDTKEGTKKLKRFGHFTADMNVIFSQRVFNLNYKCERMDMVEYVNNLKSIKEKYSITKNGDNQVVICDSLMYPKKKRESPTFHLIEGANLANLEQKCKGIKERGK